MPAGPPSPAIRCAWAIGWPGGRGGGKGDLGELRFLLSSDCPLFLWDQLLLLDIFLPVKVGEFTIWGAVRGGVRVTVGHPGLVEPVHFLKLDLKISFLWKYEAVIKVWLF